MICTYLRRLAVIVEPHLDNEEIIAQISRLYWYTIEFGLVNGNDALKIYGAGILSSPEETAYCLSKEAIRLPFNLENVLKTPYIIDKYQEQYFVLDSMRQLEGIADKVSALF